MREKLSAISRTFTNLLVVVTMITTITALIALLPYASVHKRITWFGCIAIAALGTIAVICEIRRLYRIDMARTLISRLLAEGKAITMDVGVSKGAQTEALLRDWCTRVEDVLRRYLGESYIVRFHLGGSLAQNPASMTPWKNWHRLETLAAFLTELK